MTSPADAATLTRALGDLDTLAGDELRRFWVSLPVNNPAACAAALRVYLPELTGAYGYAASLVAADWYDAVRASKNVPGNFKASMASVAPVGQAEGMAKWAVAPLFTVDGPVEVASKAALNRATGGVGRLVKQPARETIGISTVNDPVKPKYARVPVGATCAFCTMLASRGAVYYSQATAEKDYHDRCDCQGVPIFDGDALPYDADAMLDKYTAARATADTGGTKDILSEMRKDTGGH